MSVTLAFLVHTQMEGCNLTPPKISLTDFFVFTHSLLAQVDKKLGHYLFSHVTDVCFTDQKLISNNARNTEK